MELKILFVVLIYFRTFACNYQNYEQSWEDFKLKFEKSYNSAIENDWRFEIFKKNLDDITKHNDLYNAGKVTYYKGINKFTDWTDEEFVDYVSSAPNPILSSTEEQHLDEGMSGSTKKVETYIDWRQNGSISSVKDQGSCEASWAFAAAGSVEAYLYFDQGFLLNLSAQNLLDCSGNGNNCEGGKVSDALFYLNEHTIDSEENYPYVHEKKSCKSSGKDGVTKLMAFFTMLPIEEIIWDILVSTGPLTVAINVTAELKAYAGGVFDGASCDKNVTNHSALLVGLDHEDNEDYYILKNSWGESWGEDGYLRLGGVGSNPCGIKEHVHYPVIDNL